MTGIYSPLVVTILFSAAFGGIFLLLSMVMGPKRLTAEKLAPFECGSDPVGSPRVRFSVKFYQVAILFLVFDIETAFMYPWAVLYRKLSCIAPACSSGVSSFGFVEMLVF